MNSKYKGKLLISTPDMSGDIFSRAVVLVIDHNEDGAFGLVLNKKNELATKAIQKKMEIDIDVFIGGPVETNKSFFIIKGEIPITNSYLYFHEDYYLTEDIENVVNSIIDGSLNKKSVKVFSGYSGWSKNQLENEIEKKFWIVANVYQMDFTEKDPQLWKKIMQNMGGEYLIWANSPIDVSLN
ncbi:MAG: YqgE/AlgH family protein [Bacteroidetes bacterium]|jgi:putative transcriptional regulator|nr:YqgE/AlgH family protein [Bacteroidota bacterium]